MKRRLQVASPSAPPSTFAGASVLVRDAVGRDSRATRAQTAAHWCDGLLEQHLAAIELDWPLVDAVRQLRQILRRPRDAEKTIDFVVVRRHVGVPDWPVLAEAVAALRLEVVIRQPQCDPAPDVGLAAEHARTHPRVRCAGIWMLALVDDGMLGVGVPA